MRTLLIVVLIAIFGAFGALAAEVYAKGPKPKAVATPNTGLTNGTEVTVTGEHFSPNSTVFIIECAKGIKGKNGATGEPYCDINNLVQVTTDETGAIPATKFTVATGEIGTNGSTCGTSKKDKVCYIGVGGASGEKDDSTLVKLKFAAP